MKHTKKSSYLLVLLLAVLSGLVFANHRSNNETKPFPKPLTTAERKAKLEEKEKWEASPDGLKYKEWELSPAGKKIQTSYDKIKKNINAFSEMEAVVSSVIFQRENVKSFRPKWLIVRIQGEQYMMQFVPTDFKQLNSLKVSDKIVIKSRNAGYSPNHPYLILSGDFITRNNRVLFKRDFSKKKGC